MSRIYIGENTIDKLKNAKVIVPIETEEYKKICEEATEKIKKKQYEEAKAYERAKYFVALRKN